MHKLIIHQFGPLEHCELECSSFMTLTGFQASGKSTIAKAIYYFRTIKEDIVELAEKQALERKVADGAEKKSSVANEKNLLDNLHKCLLNKFLSTFGLLWNTADEMSMEYKYTPTCSVKVSLKKYARSKAMPFPVNTVFNALPSSDGTRNKFLWITFSEELKEILLMKNQCFSTTPLGVPEEEKESLKKELYKLFDDRCQVVYIPAGRSMMTLLSQQINYIYAKMGDVQKQSLDSCTRDYIERTLYLKPEFTNGLNGLISISAGKVILQSEINVIQQALILIKAVLRGSYRYSNGEEQIILDNGTYIKLNFASSGQQECVWILNLLFYYLLKQTPVLFIIEEPESHLFPESQKFITELIALVNNCGHSVILTTHSPYVLGTLNNLLYAYTMPSCYRKKASEVIDELLWIDIKQFDSWFVKNGTVENCMDEETHMIQNERIDEISKVINHDFDQLLDLQVTDEDGAAE